DADVDGAHIRTLLLTLFYRYFKPLIEGGYLYIAQPPLYKIKQGKKIDYVYTEEEKFKLVGDIGIDGGEEVDEEGSKDGEEETNSDEGETMVKKKAAKVSIQRYKGLGEMNPDELWETTMDPERRLLKQVTIDDAQEADRVFDSLMGADVAPRKMFIQSHAKEATLDI
ncbi:MAG: DNA topoisomerase IV subunit B, partial [Candidatus Pacebacteria bacterium]|nr:DNA topoisomerase IV subunit B [Candidatus Paceibacterota bacterium]